MWKICGPYLDYFVKLTCQGAYVLRDTWERLHGKGFISRGHIRNKKPTPSSTNFVAPILCIMKRCEPEPPDLWENCMHILFFALKAFNKKVNMFTAKSVMFEETRKLQNNPSNTEISCPPWTWKAPRVASTSAPVHFRRQAVTSPPRSGCLAGLRGNLHRKTEWCTAKLSSAAIENPENRERP